MRGIISLDLVMAGLMMFMYYSMASALVQTELQRIESSLAAPSCYTLAYELARVHSLSSALFGTAVDLDLPTIDPDVNNVLWGATDINVIINTTGGTTSCKVSIP